MNVIASYGKNIFIGDNVVGFIRRNELYVNKRLFATITDDGIISMANKEVGYVEDDGTIIMNDKEVGYIDGKDNFVFYK